MLDALDTIIGFSLVMLIMSMVVTMLTQMIGTGLVNLRGLTLRDGLARLLKLLDHQLTGDAEKIADLILRDPLIGSPSPWGGPMRLGSVIHREELVGRLLAFAAEAAAGTGDPASLELKRKILGTLKANGIQDPAAVLKAIRDEVNAIEQANPQWSQSVRVNMANLKHAKSEFLGKVHNWFDQTIDRVSDTFTARTRLVTGGLALLTALVVQLDSIDLLNRLSVDDGLRAALVTEAIEHPERFALAAPGAKPLPAPRTFQEAKDNIEQTGIMDLDSARVVVIPKSADEWARGWTDAWFRQLLGILISAMLLSLGAPFWYSALSNLLKMRPLIARKDDAQREERQTTQPAPAAKP